jgi:hypothetical protein
MIRVIRKQAIDGWPGDVGEDRADELEKFIDTMTQDYSEVLGLSPLKILRALEKARSYRAEGYYQGCNFPTIGMSVPVFKNKEAFLTKFPSKKYICCYCKKITTDPQECNSGFKMENIKDGVGKVACNWKS